MEGSVGLNVWVGGLWLRASFPVETVWLPSEGGEHPEKRRERHPRHRNPRELGVLQGGGVWGRGAPARQAFTITLKRLSSVLKAVVSRALGRAFGTSLSKVRGWIICLGSGPVHCRLLSSIPRLYARDARSISPCPQTLAGISKCPSGYGAKSSLS